jgi:intein/homing endonuclease/MoaA/NifB/PqqE/SkfB family radical SAM enzyme
MAKNVYSTIKSAYHPEKIEAIRKKRHVAPVAVQIIPSDLCDHDCGFCILEGSLIGKDGNSDYIENIKVGDFVRGASGRLNMVTETSRRVVDAVYRISLADRQLELTGNHEISTSEGWKRADAIKVGDAIATAESVRSFAAATVPLRLQEVGGSPLPNSEGAEGYPASLHGNTNPFQRDMVFRSVVAISQETGSFQVCNFTCTPDHTYIANGIVVHNCAYRMSGYTSNQLFQTVEGQSRKARNPNRQIPREKLLEIIDDCAEMGVKSIQFSLWGEEHIPIVRADGTTHSIGIGAWVDSQFSQPYAGGYEDKKIADQGIQSYSIDDAGQLIQAPITHVYRHQANEDLIEVTLEDGRTIIVTESHSINIIRDGKIQKVPVKDAALGEPVACATWKGQQGVAEYILPSQKKTSGVHRALNKTIKATPEFFRLMGYHTAEGTANRRGHQNMVGWILGTEGRKIHLIADILHCVHRVFGVKGQSHDRGGTTFIKLFSRAIYKLFEQWGMTAKSIHRGIPAPVWGAPDALKIEYLKGLFGGDGNWRSSLYKKGTQEYSRNSLHLKTASRRLAHDAFALLKQLGCDATLGQGRNAKRLIEGRTLEPSMYYTVNIYNRPSLNILVDIVEHLGGTIEPYVGSVYSKAEAKKRRSFPAFGLAAQAIPIKSLRRATELGRPIVYDITVGQTHRFITTTGIGCTNTGGGEPTVHPDFVEVAAYAQKKGMDTALVTNGGHLKDSELRAVVRRNVWVRISIDAATPETYCAIRNVSRRHWDDMLEGVRLLCEEAKGEALTIGAGFVTTPENWQEMYDAAALYKSLGIHNVRLGLMFNPDGSTPYEGFRDEMQALARKTTADHTDATFTVINRVSEKMSELDQGSPDFKHCSYQRLTTYIGGDQNVYRCCVLAYNLRGKIGSIADVRFKDFWLSKEVQKDFAGFDAHGCPRCQFTNIIKHTNAFIENGNLPNPKEPPPHVNFV